MTFRLIWTAILVVPLFLGCGESKSSTEPKGAAEKNRTAGGGTGTSSDAGTGSSTPEGDPAALPSTDRDTLAASHDAPNAEMGTSSAADGGVESPDDEAVTATGDAGSPAPASDPPSAPDPLPTPHRGLDVGELIPYDTGLNFRFTDVTHAAGVDHSQWDRPASLDGYPCQHALIVTGGAAAVDINNDGWTDLFVTRLEAPNQLYLNNGDGTFRDVAYEAGLARKGWSNSPAFADIDGDGDLDLFVTSAGPGKAMLFINQGDGTFTEEARGRGVDVGSEISCSELTSATFGDYNHDGAIDLYVSHWTDTTVNYNILFKNDGTGHFTNVTHEAGLTTVDSFGYSSGFMDADGDGWEDLFIVADFWNGRLFHNNKDGTFTDVTAAARVGVEEDGMGCALGDVNGDGLPDWFVSNAYEAGVVVGNRMYINRGDGTFDDRSADYGVSEGGWAWGATLFDVDNDGNLDASNVGGWTNQDQTPKLWLGGTTPWPEVGTLAGLSEPMNGRAYVPFDFDNDGDTDLFIVRNGQTPLLYRNDLSTPRHWLTVKATSGATHSPSIGARVSIEHEGHATQHNWITANNTYLGHGPFEAHFGLGADEGPFTVRVFWPASGKTSSHGLVSPDQIITVEEP